MKARKEVFEFQLLRVFFPTDQQQYSRKMRLIIMNIITNVLPVQRQTK